MKTAPLFLLALSLVFCFPNFAHADHARMEIASPQNFTKLIVKGELHVVVGDKLEKGKIAIEGDEKDVRNVRIEQKNGQITLTHKGFFAPKGRVIIFISAKELHFISANSHARVYVTKLTQKTPIQILASNAAQINIQTFCPELTTIVRDDAQIKIQGDFTRKEVVLSITDYKKTVYRH